MSDTQGKASSLTFLAAWVIVAKSTPLDVGVAFLAGLALWGLAFLTLRMASKAVYRLGRRGWSLLIQVVFWFSLFLWLAPLEAGIKILLVWGVGIPLLFAGGIARAIHARSGVQGVQWVFEPRHVGMVLFLALTGLLWWHGASLLGAIAGTTVMVSLVAIPLYYGWALGTPMPRGERDARFGTHAWYRRAGMSDDQ